LANDELAKLQQVFEEIIEQDGQKQKKRIAEIRLSDPDLAEQLENLLVEDQHTHHLTAEPFHMGEQHLNIIDHELSQGSLLGEYRILSVLASGGMGKVYLAQHIDDDIQQQVAVKVILTDRLDENSHHRFRLECGVLAQLNHPNIASLINTGFDQQGSPYLVMEYIDGLPINLYCQQNKLTQTQILSLFITVCRAVNHAHQNLIVHRDLKPSNIKVTDHGIAKLLDFGIAKALTGQIGKIQIEQTGTNQRLFSPSHVAPEQILNHNIDITCDIYALGVLLFELLTDQLPFSREDKSMGQFEHDIVHTEPTPPSRYNSAIPRDLDSIILRCLRKTPSQRYANVIALLDDIQRFQNGRPVLAHQGKYSYKLGKFMKRHWLAVSLTSLASSVLLILGLGLYQQYLKTIYQSERAQGAIDILTTAFELVDPTKSQGDQITARQILDQSVKLLETRFTEDPLLRADLLLTISEVESKIGQFNRANSLLDTVEHLLDSSAQADQPLQFRYLTERAYTKLRLDEFDQSISIVNNALTLNPEPSEQLYLETIKMKAISDQKDYIKAIEHGDMVFNQILPQIKPDDPKRWFFMHLYARLIRVSGEYERAKEIYELSLSEKLQHLNEDHPSVAQSRLDLVEMYGYMNLLELAAEQIEPARQTYLKLYSKDSLNYASFLGTENSLNYRRGKTENLLKNQWLVHEIYINTYGEFHSRIAMSHFNIALTMKGVEKPASETIAQFQTAISTADKVYEPQYRNLVFFRCVFASYLNTQNRFEESLKILNEAFAIIDEVPEYKEYDFYPLAQLAYQIASYAQTRQVQFQQGLDYWVGKSGEYIKYIETSFFEQLEVARHIGMNVPNNDDIKKASEQ